MDKVKYHVNMNHKSHLYKQEVILWHVWLTSHEKFLKNCLECRLSPRLKFMIANTASPNSPFYTSTVIASSLKDKGSEKTSFSK